MVRRARVEDVAAIAELCDEMQRVHRAAHSALFQPEDVVVCDAASVRRMLDDSAAACFVAELASRRAESEGRTIVGFARIIDTRTPQGRSLIPRRFGSIEDLVVAPGARRTGVGSTLMEAMEAWARSLGIPAVEATVWAFNRPVLELCEKQGARILRHYVRKEL